MLILTPDEVKAIWPLCETDNLVGHLHPDGYIQPADLIPRWQKEPEQEAQPYRNTAVYLLNKVQGGWKIETNKGTITCDHVVSATGNYARQTGAMVGLDIPVMPVEHNISLPSLIPR